jgi:hypothetical protein
MNATDPVQMDDLGQKPVLSKIENRVSVRERLQW